MAPDLPSDQPGQARRRSPAAGKDHLLNRQPGEQWIPVAEDQGLPEAADAAVAIGEGMDELQLVVHNATGQEWMPIGALQPTEQVCDQRAHSCSRGRHVHQLCPPIDPDAAGAKTSRAIHQPGHQQAVGIQQILLIAGVPSGQRLIGGDGVADFLNVARGADHPLAIEESCDLLQAEAVLLDRQRRLDGVDAVGHAAAAVMALPPGPRSTVRALQRWPPRC